MCICSPAAHLNEEFWNRESATCRAFWAAQPPPWPVISILIFVILHPPLQVQLDQRRLEADLSFEQLHTFLLSDQFQASRASYLVVLLMATCCRGLAFSPLRLWCFTSSTNETSSFKAWAIILAPTVRSAEPLPLMMALLDRLDRYGSLSTSWSVACWQPSVYPRRLDHIYQSTCSSLLVNADGFVIDCDRLHAMWDLHTCPHFEGASQRSL